MPSLASSTARLQYRGTGVVLLTHDERVANEWADVVSTRVVSLPLFEGSGTLDTLGRLFACCPPRVPREARRGGALAAPLLEEEQRRRALLLCATWNASDRVTALRRKRSRGAVGGGATAVTREQRSRNQPEGLSPAR